jgi:hypothetical protein
MSHEPSDIDPNMSAPYVSVAAEVWVAAALLHREQPHRVAFRVAEIVDRARREALVPSLRPGVTAYATGHAVANKRPSPNTLRLLYEPEPGLRRLFRTGDPSDPDRHGRNYARTGGSASAVSRAAALVHRSLQ